VFEPDQVIVHGVDKHKFESFREYRLTDGSMEEFRAARDGALVGASIARRKSWSVGETVDLRGQLGLLLEVKGVFVSGNEDEDNTILAGMDYVQDQYNARGQANFVMVKLRPEARAETVAAEIDALPTPTGTNSQAEKAFVSGMIEDLADMIALSRLVILLTLAVVLVSVSNAVSMSVRDRTRQLGVMRTLGFRRVQILGLVMAEAALVCVIGGALGVAAAWALIALQDISVQARSLHLTVSMPWAVAGYALLVSLGIGAAGSLVSGLRASRLKIVDAVSSVG
jgi:putative ABC transport system permease protein